MFYMQVLLVLSVTVLFQSVGGEEEDNITALQDAAVNINATTEYLPPGDEVHTNMTLESTLKLLTLLNTTEEAESFLKALRNESSLELRLVNSTKLYVTNDTTHRAAGLYILKTNHSVVLNVPNYIPARLPGARITIKKLREVLFRRARRNEEMPLSPISIYWAQKNDGKPVTLTYNISSITLNWCFMNCNNNSG